MEYIIFPLNMEFPNSKIDKLVPQSAELQISREN